MPGVFRCDRGDYTRMLILFCMRGCGRIARPAFPAPSDWRVRKSRANLGWIMPRDREIVSERHCEEPTGPAFGRPDDRLRDEAIHSFLRRLWIASRSLSSGARSRDPLARNDGRIGCLKIEFLKLPFGSKTPAARTDGRPARSSTVHRAAAGSACAGRAP
jgi:hypothetical protein